jgi:receptor expression-enhancing protein 1/2/3/4
MPFPLIQSVHIRILTYYFNRIPFYPWIRAGFLLYLIAPQTQGARLLYQNQVHPFLQEHETAIEDFISSAHDRAKTAGINYLKQAVELLKQHLLGLPPPQPTPPPPPTNLSYTQSLIARFNLPSARSVMPSGGVGSAATSTAADFYALLASAVSAATAAAPHATQSAGADHEQERDLSNSGTLIPPTIQGTDRMSFISAQRERLSILLSALDKEASSLKMQNTISGQRRPSNMLIDENSSSESEQARPPSSMSGLSKSRSELDFEKIEKDEENGGDSQTPVPSFITQSSGSWLPWSWGSKATVAETSKDKEVDTAMGGVEAEEGKSTGVEI